MKACLVSPARGRSNWVLAHLLQLRHRLVAPEDQPRRGEQCERADADVAADDDPSREHCKEEVAGEPRRTMGRLPLLVRLGGCHIGTPQPVA